MTKRVILVVVSTISFKAPPLVYMVCVMHYVRVCILCLILDVFDKQIQLVLDM